MRRSSAPCCAHEIGVSESSLVTGAVWRKRMQELSRNVGVAHAPLFAPLVFSSAAQVESISIIAMAHDATRLRKSVTEQRRALGLNTVVCTVPSAMELEAAGAVVSQDWPPRILSTSSVTPQELDASKIAQGARVCAAVEAIRQIALADTSAPVVVAAVTGPATVLAQARANGLDLNRELGYEFAGRMLGILARMYTEAGAHVLQVHEASLPANEDIKLWKSALGTAGNVARFHRVPPVLVIAAVCTLKRTFVAVGKYACQRGFNG